MAENTRVLGVFGHPISHSLSPVMQNAAIQALAIDYIYVPFHVLPDGLRDAVQAIRALDLAGVNVTIPHKEHIVEFLDEVTDAAAQVGSVNVVINQDGHLKGDTTDGPGFMKSMEAEWGSEAIRAGNALVLGAGGSAKAICYALAGAGWRIVVANRTCERAAELTQRLNSVFGKVSKAVRMDREVVAHEIDGVDLLVNTTSVGMYPRVEDIPLPPELLRACVLVYDLVYNPAETRLVAEARSRGARAMTGLSMLVYQGALSLEMWTGRQAPIMIMQEAVRRQLTIDNG